MKFFLLSVALALVACGGSSKSDDRGSSAESSLKAKGGKKIDELSNESIADKKEASNASENIVLGEKNLNNTLDLLDQGLGDIDQSNVAFKEEASSDDQGAAALDREEDEMSRPKIVSLLSSVASLLVVAAIIASVGTNKIDAYFRDPTHWGYKIYKPFKDCYEEWL